MSIKHNAKNIDNALSFWDTVPVSTTQEQYRHIAIKPYHNLSPMNLRPELGEINRHRHT